MALADQFDAVLMITWSNWKTEPRSNRYHYATRFSRFVPVLFFQHESQPSFPITVEKTKFDNIDLVISGWLLSNEDVQTIRKLISARGIRRPLVWIYDSIHYAPLIDALPGTFLAYHATEDYFGEDRIWGSDYDVVRKSIIQLVKKINLVVACSEGVASSYRGLSDFNAPLIVSDNGCDTAYLFEQVALYRRDKVDSNIPVALFQGGINQRLDYDLLFDVITNMRDWEFHFCGAAIESEGWDLILQQKNVSYLGALHPDDLARRMCEATVGIIPFVQDRMIKNSLPLKAYEYVACGLPVVTVPIRSLEREVDLMTTATTASEFEAAIRGVADSRYDPVMLERRRTVALANSYDSRLFDVCEALVGAKESLIHSSKRFKIAMLYDAVSSMHVNTIREHLEAFRKYSSHDYTFIPATPSYWQQPPEEVEKLVNFSVFDAVFVHYSIRVSISEHFEEGLVRALEKFNGLKAIFIQDEYEGTERARAWMDRIGFDLVYTCVPLEGLQLVYPGYRFPATEFLPTLTGYVPEDDSIEHFAKPLSERKLLIAYRGRKLPVRYGELGYEKFRIGSEMKAIATMRGLAVDIEVDDSMRIYGTGWYEFLGSARATLGTESGSNIFDFDGSLSDSIARFETENPGVGFEEIYAKVLAPHEGRVSMNQVSPKIFEAIRLRTALVLFEGNYSGVVQPDVHFISLKKDFSNVDEVLAKLQDDDYLNAMTNRAYMDVVSSGKYSYQGFVEGVDSELERRILRSKSYSELVSRMFVDSDGSLIQSFPLLPDPSEPTAGYHPLKRPQSVATLEELASLEQELAALKQEVALRLDQLESKVSSSRYLLGLLARTVKSRIAGLGERLRRPFVSKEEA